MAEIIGGIGISHTPSMGTEYDRGMRDGFTPEWQKWFDGTRPVKAWLQDARPDQIVIIYNDHLNHFEFEAIPTLAIGVAEEYQQADEGWGPRAFPSLRGDTDFGWQVTTRLIRDFGFDLTVCQELSVNHGVYSWLPYVADTPWNTPILPIAVNMMRHPVPTSQRLHQLGLALRRTLREMAGQQRVLIVATGGMSHQISGTRFGIANVGLDQRFLERIGAHPEELLRIPQEELMRLGGTEAAELSIWFAMRAALCAEPREVYRFHTFPRITGCGVIILEEAA